MIKPARGWSNQTGWKNSKTTTEKTLYALAVRFGFRTVPNYTDKIGKE
jgi:hypothetical protein